MWRSLKRREFRFDGEKSGKDRIRYMTEGGIIIAVLAIFFYRSLWAAPFLTPIFLLYCKEKKKEIAFIKRKETQVQFKDAILSVSASQKAGYSIENSFKHAYEDMELLYGKESVICKELYTIVMGLSNNVVLEKLLYNFGKRSGVEDVMEFAEVFAAAKRNGGNMTEIIERSASVIDSKVETEKEIGLLLAARRMEQKIMNAVPFGILLYIGITSRGFFEVLYHNLPGVLIMTGCLFVYIAAVLISRKIVSIEV